MTDAVSAPGDPFVGSGEMRGRCRELDWEQTPLGAVASWSSTLRDTVRTCLDSPFPINLWCGHDLALIYNDAYREVLGRKHPAALGRSGREVWREIWPEIAPLFDRIAAGGPATFAEDASFVVERADTDVGDDATPSAPNAWFTFSLSAVRDEEGELIAFLNIVSETTRRVLAERATTAARARAERAEARLREVFSQAPAFMAVLRGSDHVFEYVNEAYYRLVGHRELLGRSVWQALPEVRGQGIDRLLHKVLETGEPYVGRELPIMIAHTPDSEPVQHYLDFIYYPITEPDGTRSGVVAHGFDVSEHVLARAEAQRARAEAEQANQAKSQFLANMSHEIRTPINAVMGYTDLLDAGIAGALSARQHEYVQRIRESSRHLLGLVDDVLDLSKVEAGEMMVRVEKTDLADVVDAALQMTAAQAEATGIAIHKDWDCDRRALVMGDANRIRQTILNLLSNSLKFTPSGGTITVRCRIVDAPDPLAALPDTGPWVIVEVEDTGKGIPADQLTRIFEPFVQVEGGHTRPASGTGLGLTISRRFARLMGGDLTVRSSLGNGASFILWLTPAVQSLQTTADWVRAARLPESPREMPGLGALGKLLLAATERVEENLVTRITADPEMVTARRVERAQIADHTAGVLAVMARTMSALDEGSEDQQLIRDGLEMQDMMARRHGRQRLGIGWSRSELIHEYLIFHDVLDSVLRREGAQYTTADLDGAVSVVHRLLDRAQAASLAGFDAAQLDRTSSS